MCEEKRVTPMPYRRILAVGDIHGCYQKFLTLWERLAFDPAEDLVVFLGDYTDRGPESRDVMEWVLAHAGQKHMFFLRGNHDEMMLAALLGVEKELWIRNGGDTTCESLRGKGDLNAFLMQWAKTIQQMPLYLEIEQDGQTYWFMHGGFVPGVPLAEQEEETFLWNRDFAEADAYDGKEVVTVGHTIVQYIYYDKQIEPETEDALFKPMILDGGRRILLDTGGFLAGGRISAIDVLTKTVWQSDPMPELGGW